MARGSATQELGSVRWGTAKRVGIWHAGATAGTTAACRPRCGDVARWLAVICLALAGLAWIYGNAPSGAPDELAHYVKALGVGGGDILGDAPTPAPRRSALTREGSRNLARLVATAQGAHPPAADEARRLAWTRRQTRRFAIPSEAQRELVLRLTRNSASPMPKSTACGPAERRCRDADGDVPVPYVLPGLTSASPRIRRPRCG